MRAYLAFAALMLLPAAAHADVVADARSATGACLSAVIDGAPVGDVTEGPIAIRRRDEEPRPGAWREGRAHDLYGTRTELDRDHVARDE